MRLFGTPGSPFAREVRIVLEEKRIPHEYIIMEQDLGAGAFCFGGRFTLADIAAGYALDYLDFALPEVEWRKAHPALARLTARLAARKSFSGTAHAKNT